MQLHDTVELFSVPEPAVENLTAGLEPRAPNR